jgi:SAM-dependent methyltransferase
MSGAPRYHRWIARLIRPHLGRRILEVGAGIANMTPWLLDGERVFATDPEPEYIEILRKHLGGYPNVSVRALRLPDVAESWRAERLDTVVLVNVLEHVVQDVESLRSLAGALVPGGRVVVFVPAMPVLYGSLDRALGHVRRYRPRELREAFERAGIEVERVRYYNLLGMLGWGFYSRVLRREILPALGVRIFDALVPLLARVEELVPVPIGQSLLVIGRVRG